MVADREPGAVDLCARELYLAASAMILSLLVIASLAAADFTFIPGMTVAGLVLAGGITAWLTLLCMAVGRLGWQRMWPTVIAAHVAVALASLGSLALALVVTLGTVSLLIAATVSAAAFAEMFLTLAVFGLPPLLCVFFALALHRHLMSRLSVLHMLDTSSE